jgi:hypothetical protein
MLRLIFFFLEILRLKGEGMFRSMREKGKWGTPEQLRINLKQVICHIFILLKIRGNLFHF